MKRYIHHTEKILQSTLLHSATTDIGWHNQIFKTTEYNQIQWVAVVCNVTYIVYFYNNKTWNRLEK